MRHGVQAIVLGASMGGLVAAAALADSYDHVTVVDRDTLPSGPEHRRGVPQSKHSHGLLPGGLRALERLLPGLTDELVAAGAPSGDVSSDSCWFVGGGRLATAESGITGLGCTRPFLEHHVRARVAALANVEFLDATEATALTWSTHGGRPEVHGVVLSSDGRKRTMSADLVVDCTGRVSKLPDWLRSMGCPAPVEEQVSCGMGYLTRRWRLADDNPAMAGVNFSVVAPADTPHFGVVIRQEDGTHIMTLGGLLGQAPAKTDEAYVAFARTLPDQRLADALVGASPVTDLQPSHFPCSRRRRYDRLRSFPDGLLALGDAIASFNPMYGQGMSVAALEAVRLREMLAAGRLDAHRFFKAAHRIEDVAWKISTGGDLRFAEVEGRRTPDSRVMNLYLDRVALAARSDAVVAHAFLQVAAFVEPPESLFAPRLARRVLRGARTARKAGAPAVQTYASVLPGQLDQLAAAPHSGHS